MAAYTASTAKTLTLTASQVDTITLTGTGQFLRIAQGSATPVYCTAVPTGASPTAATAAGDNTVAVINSSQPVELGWPGTGAVISVITAGVATLVSFTLHD